MGELTPAQVESLKAKRKVREGGREGKEEGEGRGKREVREGGREGKEEGEGRGKREVREGRRGR